MSFVFHLNEVSHPSQSENAQDGNGHFLHSSGGGLFATVQPRSTELWAFEPHSH